VWSNSVLDSASQWVTVPKWFDEAPIDYGHGLLSYMTWRSHRAPVAFPEGVHIFGDSSGFSLIGKPTERLDSIDVLLWQKATCSVGAILDRPPRKAKRRDFDACLAFTMGNVKRALPRYQRSLDSGHAYRWWGVLHGNTEDEALQWYEALSAVYRFDLEGEGWGVYPGPQANPYTVARTCRILRSLGITRAHFFACTGQDVIATILAIGPMAGLEFVTFDSMSFAVASMHRYWFAAVRPNDAKLGRTSQVTPDVPHIVANRTRGGTYYEFENLRCLDEMAEEFCLACPCRVCRWLQDNSEITVAPGKNTPSGWRDTAIALHNVHIQQQAIERQKMLANKDPAGFLVTSLGQTTAASVLRIFENQESDSIVTTRRQPGLLAGLKR
jgi:hypothetical protein